VIPVKKDNTVNAPDDGIDKISLHFWITRPDVWNRCMTGMVVTGMFT